MRNNWRVVIAIPRKDIVCELAIRLQTVFPHSIIKPLYEQAKDDYDADIVVSTIHQLIRYYQEFDWIVVDEADAFPLRGNAYLHRLIQKALKPGGTIFQMSATKSKEITKEIATGKILVHTIPSRFHQRALDCPQMIQVSNLNSCILKEKLLPKEIRLWLDAKKAEKKQTILFVPSIRFGTVLSEVLVKEGFLCKNVSSLSENGAEIIAHFRKSQILFLVSTTLLERGVTFKAIDCGVLGCDQSVFDFDCLVQICGRVGRTAEFPNGEIVFFSEERTKAMVKALQYIKKMNQEARRKGLLTDEM
jgi:competence protein ComFA